jgi:hypothetical protein
MHFHPTDDQFLVGGFVLILGIVIAVAAFLEKEKKKSKAQPFSNYFCAEYDPSLLPDVGFEEPEDSPAERPSRF